MPTGGPVDMDPVLAVLLSRSLMLLTTYCVALWKYGLIFSQIFVLKEKITQVILHSHCQLELEDNNLQ